jgi:hypothetical protein
MRLLFVAGLLALLAVAPAHAAPGKAPCNLAVAKKAVAATKLRMELNGADAVRVAASSANRVLCYDFTRDGHTDLAVTIASGGTAGDVGFAVFRSIPAGWRVALARNGYKLGLFRVGGDLVSSHPVYKQNDPNCCPTGGFDHSRFHWSGRRFVVTRSWHSGSYKP